MNRKGIFDYYSRDEVQQALLKASDKREVIGVFKDGGFSTRPNTLVYPKDIMMQVRSGAVAFHGSLERWSNPMAVGTEDYESGRTGWDLILDIDCESTEHGIVAGRVFLDALRKHGINSVGVKFTGGTGFHIGVPFEAMPAMVDYKETSGQYPGLARKLADYLREFARADLEKALLKRWSVEQLAGQAGAKVGDIMTEDGIDPFRVTNVDPILISPRHLFRLPYSLHERTHLVSIPIMPDDLEDFRPDMAGPDKVRFDIGFMDKFEPNEASMLVVEAVDWYAKHKHKAEPGERPRFRPRQPVPIKFAPPCVQNILNGLSDGRKRSIFILINYLSSLGWGWEEINESLVRWNQRNKPPLREGLVTGQVRWHRHRKKPMPPPNCDNIGYYQGFGVCKPDQLCGGQKRSIKNPINYAIRKLPKKK